MTQGLSNDDIERFRSCLRVWGRAGTHGSWSDLTDFLADEILFLPPDHPPVAGRDAVMAWLERYPPIGRFETWLEQAAGGPDMTWTWGRFENVMIPEVGADPVRVVGKWSATWRRDADGVWRMTSDTWNADHPVA